MNRLIHTILWQLPILVAVSTTLAEPTTFQWDATTFKIGTYFPSTPIASDQVGVSTGLVSDGLHPVRVRHQIRDWSGISLTGSGSSLMVTSDDTFAYRGENTFSLQFFVPNAVPVADGMAFGGVGWSLPGSQAADPLEPSSARWFIGFAGDPANAGMARLVHGNHLGADLGSLGLSFPLSPLHWYRVDVTMSLIPSQPNLITDLRVYDLGQRRVVPAAPVAMLEAPIEVDIGSVSAILTSRQSSMVILARPTRAVPQLLEFGSYRSQYKPVPVAARTAPTVSVEAENSGELPVIPIAAAAGALVLGVVVVAILAKKKKPDPTPTASSSRTTSSKNAGNTRAHSPEPKVAPVRRHIKDNEADDDDDDADDDEPADNSAVVPFEPFEQEQEAIAAAGGAGPVKPAPPRRKPAPPKPRSKPPQT